MTRTLIVVLFALFCVLSSASQAVQRRPNLRTGEGTTTHGFVPIENGVREYVDYAGKYGKLNSYKDVNYANQFGGAGIDYSKVWKNGNNLNAGAHVDDQGKVDANAAFNGNFGKDGKFNMNGTYNNVPGGQENWNVGAGLSFSF